MGTLKNIILKFLDDYIFIKNIQKIIRIVHIQ